MKPQLKQQIKTRQLFLRDLNNQHEHYTNLAQTSLHVNYSEVISGLKNRISALEKEIKSLEEEYDTPDKSYLKAKIDIRKALLQRAPSKEKSKLAKEIEQLESEYYKIESKLLNQIFRPIEKLSAAEYRSQE